MSPSLVVLLLFNKQIFTKKHGCVTMLRDQYSVTDSVEKVKKPSVNLI